MGRHKKEQIKLPTKDIEKSDVDIAKLFEFKKEVTLTGVNNKTIKV
jgi:hypothetical protein